MRETVERELERGPLAGRREEILELLEPTVGLDSARAGMDALAIGQSRLGGLPDLPQDAPWPRWKGEPQSFLAQLALAELRGLPGSEALPDSGWLVFFYSARQDTWGFAPEDRDSWHVLYLPGAVELFRRAAPDGLRREAAFYSCLLRPRAMTTLPPWESLPVTRLGLDDEATDAYCDLLDGIWPDADHWLLGWPDQIQGDIAAECQLVSHGLNLGDASAWTEPGSAELLERSDEWRLLLQIGSDDDAGMMWGDAGKLYFSIRRADLERGEFDGTWMTLQCH